MPGAPDQAAVVPRCDHGNIILGCPDAYCEKQNAYLDEQVAALGRWHKRQQAEAREIVNAVLRDQAAEDCCGVHQIRVLRVNGGKSMGQRFRTAWRAFFGGPIGPIGWCGQIGYWWTRPCGHVTAGCGWFDGQRVIEAADV